MKKCLTAVLIIFFIAALGLGCRRAGTKNPTGNATAIPNEIEALIAEGNSREIVNVLKTDILIRVSIQQA